MNRSGAYFSSTVNVETGERDIVVIGGETAEDSLGNAHRIHTYVYCNFCLCVRGGTEQVVNPRISLYILRWSIGSPSVCIRLQSITCFISREPLGPRPKLCAITLPYARVFACVYALSANAPVRSRISA